MRLTERQMRMLVRSGTVSSWAGARRLILQDVAGKAGADAWERIVSDNDTWQRYDALLTPSYSVRYRGGRMTVTVEKVR